MATSTLAKHYSLLDGAERFTAVVEAMARGDAEELDRLDESCPRALYEMDDPAYRTRLTFGFSVAGLACASIQRDLDVLRTIAVMHEVFGLFRNFIKENAEQAFFSGWYARGRQARGTAQMPADDECSVHGDLMLVPVDIALRSITRAIGEHRAISLMSAWEGLRRFSRENCGIEPLTMTKAMRLLDEDPEAETRRMYPEVKVDSAQANHWHTSLTSAWRKQIDGL